MNWTKEQQIQKMLKILDDTVKYYSKNPIKRRAYGEDGCEYLTAKGQKCAIGRLLCKTDLKFAATVVGSFDDLIRTFERDMQPIRTKVLNQLPFDFFDKLQLLHDRDHYWTSSELSVDGQDFVQSMKSKILSGEYFNKEEIHHA